ncbi:MULTISPECIES: hypothetical protein [unclassified Acinetobacter]|uniref:hypothetical protein n=1 Tax=unclassified Acinetobacter TaxID=196816 RepID=UPI0015D10CDB|nr:MULTISPECIES: hypothetical protein [unclassified Acinetobacter]
MRRHWFAGVRVPLDWSIAQTMLSQCDASGLAVWRAVQPVPMDHFYLSGATVTQ